MNPRDIAIHNKSVESVSRMYAPKARWEFSELDYTDTLAANDGDVQPAIEWAKDYASALGRKFTDDDLFGDDGSSLAFAAIGYLQQRLAAGDTFEYIVSMGEAWKKWGSLSAGQIRGVLNCLRADVNRAEEELAFRDRFPRIVEALHQAQAKAEARLEERRQKAPHATVVKGAWILLPVMGGLVKLSVAGSTSRYTGDIHVAEKAPFGEGQYYGRIERRTGEATPQLARHEFILQVLRELEADPSVKIREFSRLMGRCSICGRELTNEKSIEAGIGPVCADKVGW